MRYFQPVSPAIRQLSLPPQKAEEVIDGEFVVVEESPHREEEGREEEVPPTQPEEVPPPPPPPPPPQPTNGQAERHWYSSLASTAGWGLAVALVAVVAMLLIRDRETTAPAVKTLASTSVPVVVPSASTTGPIKLVVRENDPQRITVPSAHRWDLVAPIPTGWTTDNGSRDERGNRIQIFEVVAPATEVTLQVAITPCASAQNCAW